VSLNTLPQITIGGMATAVPSGGIVPGAAGLYQIAVQIPANAPNGDLPVVVQLGTAASVSALITVKK
jgi:uncharacterized protein (TIGR03437 family)